MAHPLLKSTELPSDWQVRFGNKLADDLKLAWDSPWKRLFRQLDMANAAVTGSEEWPSLYCAAWASTRGVDIIVTRNGQLLSLAEEYPVSAVNPMTPREALGYLGLYLRSQNDFTVVPGRHAQDRWMYYWSLTRSLLPEAWRWFSSCLHSGREDLAGLAQSVLTRVDHALRSRDRMLAWLHIREGNDSIEEMVMGFDHMVVCMAAALDAIARATGEIEGIAYSRRPAWQDSKWLAQVRTGNERLADVFLPGSEAAMALDLLFTLRNQIHAESLAGASSTSAQEGEMTPPLIFISDDAPRLSRLLTRLSVPNECHTMAAREVFVDVAACSEVLLAHTVRSLNAIMRWTNLPVIPGRSGSSGLPSAADREFGLLTQRRIRLLSGVPALPFAPRSAS